MKTHRAGLAVEKPDSTQRGSGLTVTITNTYLPAIEELLRKRRSRARDGLTPDDAANDLFDVSVLLKELEDPADAEGRRWPALADRPRDRVPDLERIVDTQSKDLSRRCAQIADLSNANQQQAEALLIAREAIEGLDRSVTLLREELTQQDHEAANAKQELLHARNETNALREKAEKAEKELDELLQKNLQLSTALNERDFEIASAQEKIASLEADLFAASVKNAGPATARKETGTRSGSDERCARLEKRVEELEQQLLRATGESRSWTASSRKSARATRGCAKTAGILNPNEARPARPSDPRPTASPPSRRRCGPSGRLPNGSWRS